MTFGHQGLAEPHDPFELLLDRSHHGFGFKRRPGWLGLGQFRNPDRIVGIGLDIVLDLALGEALYQDFDPFIREFEHPHDDPDGADLVDVVRLGILDVQGFLGGQEDHPVPGQRRLDGLDRHVAADKERQDHVREDDDVPDREQGHLIRDLDVLGFGLGRFCWHRWHRVKPSWIYQVWRRPENGRPAACQSTICNYLLEVARE